MPMRLISLRASVLPWAALPYGAMSDTWLMKPEVQACPPVLEYTCVSTTSTLIGLPDINKRDRFWKPMSYMAPSPPRLTTGGHSSHSSSLNCCQSKRLKNSPSRSTMKSPPSSMSAMRTALKPSAILAMWPSNRPMATEGESWNRCDVHGKG